MLRTRSQSTTSYPINFLMVLSTDHNTGATGKTVTATLSKNGAGFGAAAGAVTELTNGWYSLAGNATDRNTLGELLIHATAAGCDPVDITCSIITVDAFTVQLGLTNLDAAVSSRSTYGGGDTSGTTTLLTRIPGTVQPQTGDSYARIGAAGAGLTALGDTRIAHLDADVSSRLAPTAAGRTLDVAATGEAGLDFDNIKQATGATTLNNITVPVVTTTGTATNLTNAPSNGDFTAAMKTSLNAATPASVGSVTGNVGGNVVGSVGSVATGGIDASSLAANAITAAKIATDAIGSAQLAASAVTEIQSGLATSAMQTSIAAQITGVQTDTTNLLARLGAIAGTGANTVLGYFKALLSKSSTLPSDIGGTFDPAEDSTEAIRDNVMLASSYTAPDNATIATIASGISTLLTNVAAIPGAVWAYTDRQLTAFGFSTGATAVEIRTEMDANSTKLANLDAAVSSRSTLTAAQAWTYGTRTLTAFNFGTEVTLTSPINRTGDIEEIYQGSDYYAAENNALVWVLSNPPSLTGATAVFNVAGQTFPATIVTLTNTITVELPRAKTLLMTLGRDKYALIITFASTHRTVKIVGYATVYPEPS